MFSLSAATNGEILTGDARGKTESDRRERRDRRERHPLLTDWRWAFGGRRRRFRRRSDCVSARTVLDWYRPSLLFFVVSTYVLSGIDALLTLTLLGLGVGVEANPLMNMLISKDVALFVGVKTLVTGVGLVSLAVYSKLRLFAHVHIEFVIYGLFTIYVVLVGYEIFLLRLAESQY